MVYPGSVLATGVTAAGIGYDQTQPHLRASLDDWLAQWLKQLVINLPPYSGQRGGLSIEISSGSCTQFRVGDLSTVREGYQVTIDAMSLAAACSLDWAAESLAIPHIGGKGSVLAQVNNSKIGVPFSFAEDRNQQPFLPDAIQVGKCAARIHVTDLRFTGNTSSTILNALSPFIKWVLTHTLGGVICKQLGDASKALHKVSGSWRDLLATEPDTPSVPPPLSEPHHDFADIGYNPGVIMVQQLIDKVLMNASSQHSLNNIFRKFLDANGALVFRPNGLVLPFKHRIDLKDIGVIDITIEEVSMRGLDTLSHLRLNTVDEHHLALNVGLQKINISSAVKLEVTPAPRSPVQGGRLLQKLDVAVSFSNLSGGAAFFAAVNRTWLAEFAINQLADLGCWAIVVPSALETEASLRLPSISVSVAPTGGDVLEQHVNGMLSSVLGMLAEQFADALDASSNHGIGVLARDMVNERIGQVLADPPQCVEPQPTYTSVELSNAATVAAIFLFVCVATLMPVLGIFNWRRHKKTASRSSSQEETHSGSCSTDHQSERQTVVTLPVETGTHVELMAFSHEGSPSGKNAPSTGIGGGRDWRWHCLAFHPRVWPGFSWGLPVLDLAVACCFLASNAAVATSVRLEIFANSQPVVHLPPTFSFGLISSIKEFMESRVYVLAFLVIVFSGVWPFVKLFMMMFCWFAPTSWLNTDRRLSLLDFLDTWGKWSLLDAFVMVLFMVAFKLDLSAETDEFPTVRDILQEAASSAQMRVLVEAEGPFHLFVIATFGSLAVGHVMTACHRHALQIAEYSPLAVLNTGRRQRLCNALRPPGPRGWIFVFGPIIAMGFSLALVVVGIWIDTFCFTFGGMTGYILGPAERVRCFSVISLGTAIPGASRDPNSFEVIWLQMFYLTFAALTVLAYFSILIVLWCAPLSPRLQTHFFVAAQVLQAWSGVEVLVFSILACIAQIQTFCKFMVGSKCDGLNALLKVLPIYDDVPEPKTCFDVQAGLRAGFWILLSAAMISMIVGRLMIARCKSALCSEVRTM